MTTETRLLAMLLLLSLCLTASAQTLPDGVIRDGNGWMFRDPLYGYSMFYPGSFRLLGAADTHHGLSLPKARRGEGIRFSLRPADRCCDVLRPSLIGVIRGLDPRFGPLTQSEVVKASRDSALGRATARPLEDLHDVSLGGVVYESFTYQRAHSQTGKSLVTRAYCHYDPRARLAYTFFLTSCKQHAPDNFARLESVLSTVRLAKINGPAPCEPVRPAGLLY